MPEKQEKYYWERFLQTGSINDYLNYKLFSQKKENEENDTNSEISRDRTTKT